MTTERSLPQRSPTRTIAWSLVVSMAASIGLGVVYARGGQPQLEGALLFFALGGISAAFIVWGGKLLPQGPYIQQRHPLPSGVAEQDEATDTFEEGAETLERRRLLIRLLTGAFVALGAALVFPVRSLGERPGGSLFRTAWRRGSRAVDENDRDIARVGEVVEDPGPRDDGIAERRRSKLGVDGHEVEVTGDAELGGSFRLSVLRHRVAILMAS